MLPTRCTPENVPARRTAPPNVKPGLLGLTPSFGFGDHTGLTTPGHVKAMQARGSSLSAIFAQQSIREMTRTERTAQCYLGCIPGLEKWSTSLGVSMPGIISAGLRLV